LDLHGFYHVGLLEYFISKYKSATTADSELEKRMTTRSAVDENTVLVAGLTGKTKARAIVSQSGAGASEDEQAITNEEDTKGQHPVSSKQQVNEPLYEPIEFDDTAEFNIDDTAEITINKSVVSELFPDHSSSIICENDVILDTVSYPDTIEGCIQATTILRHREKALHLL